MRLIAAILLLSSSTALAQRSPMVNYVPSTGGTMTGDLLVGTHAGIDSATGSIAVAPYASPAFYADQAFAAFDSHYLLQGFNAEGPQFSFVQAYDYGAGRVNPYWRMGRMYEDPTYGLEWRLLHGDDDTSEHNVLVVEETGTVASVRNAEAGRGSHFEGWHATGDTKPVFRLNSSPDMGLEFGAGGSSTDTDVGWRRNGAGIMGLDNGVLANAGATVEFTAITAPSAPTASSTKARLYVETSGGKQRFCALFDSGVAQCFATEP